MATYSPGDGVTRYRFFEKPSDYFGPENGTYTALGLKEATIYARGRLDAQNANRTAKSYENSPGGPCVPLRGFEFNTQEEWDAIHCVELGGF